MEIVGYIAAFLIGVSLGLIGGGGSILTVPVLVYLFGFNSIVASTLSLFVVGTTSLIGAVSFIKQKLIHYKIVLSFGVPSVIAVYVTRQFILPLIPDEIYLTNSFSIQIDAVLLALFALLMIFAAFKMLAENTSDNQEQQHLIGSTSLIANGLFIGFLSGLLGAGGGFLIIPILLKKYSLSIKMAIGTSIVIVAINSILGFVVSIDHIKSHLNFLLGFSSFAIIGVLAGSAISKKVNANALKKSFAYFIFVVAAFILFKEFIIK